MISKLIFY